MGGWQREHDGVDDDAEVDPHWQELLGRTSDVPTSYQPASMAVRAHGWQRVAAWTLLVLLVTVTAGGVCLTYGPDELFALLRS
jgi:hypothetical protein